MWRLAMTLGKSAQAVLFTAVINEFNEDDTDVHWVKMQHGTSARATMHLKERDDPSEFCHNI